MMVHLKYAHHALIQIVKFVRLMENVQNVKQIFIKFMVKIVSHHVHQTTTIKIQAANFVKIAMVLAFNVMELRLVIVLPVPADHIYIKRPVF